VAMQYRRSKVAQTTNADGRAHAVPSGSPQAFAKRP
jgi:hypothetical protein